MSVVAGNIEVRINARMWSRTVPVKLLIGPAAWWVGLNRLRHSGRGHSSHIQRAIPKCGLMTLSRTIFTKMPAAAIISLVAVMPAFAQAGMDCLTDRQIQAAIESGEILSWPSVKRMAGISAYEEVSDVRVCMIGGVPVYILNVISPEGEASKIALNAVDGTEETL